ncbi:Hypothetical predicted protein, partial [Paramuricea clavata]
MRGTDSGTALCCRNKVFVVELAKISCPGCGFEISQANYCMSAKRIILWRGSVGYLLPLVMEVSSVVRFQRQLCSGVYKVKVGFSDSCELNRFAKRSFDGPGLQDLGISGDLWSWIADYLSDRSQMTVLNGCQSQSMSVQYGVPQGSVLGPILFSLYCNDLPEICDDDEGDIYMYADDTTIYVIGPTHDSVATTLNRVICKLHEWCCNNFLTPHPDKTEFMILGRGIEIDSTLKWKAHLYYPQSHMGSAYTRADLESSNQ